MALAANFLRSCGARGAGLAGFGAPATPVFRQAPAKPTFREGDAVEYHNITGRERGTFIRKFSMNTGTRFVPMAEVLVGGVVRRYPLRDVRPSAAGFAGFGAFFPPVMINSEEAAAAKRLRAELDIILGSMPYTEPGEGTDLRAALYRVLGRTGTELRVKHILNDALLVVRSGDVDIQSWLAFAGWAVWSAIPGTSTLHLQVQRLSPADRATVAAGTESFMGLGARHARRAWGR